MVLHLNYFLVLFLPPQHPKPKTIGSKEGAAHIEDDLSPHQGVREGSDETAAQTKLTVIVTAICRMLTFARNGDSPLHVSPHLILRSTWRGYSHSSDKRTEAQRESNFSRVTQTGNSWGSNSRLYDSEAALLLASVLFGSSFSFTNVFSCGE